MNKQGHNNEKSNFCQNNIWYWGVFLSIILFIFSFTSILLHVRIILTCIILSCLLYFGIARLEMELSCEEALWGAALRDRATLLI